MKIGINLLAINPGISGGIEYYAFNLIDALSKIDFLNEYYVFLNRESFGKTKCKADNFHLININVDGQNKIGRIVYEQIYFPIIAVKFKLKVLHSLTYTWPVLANVAGLVTICDMLYKTYPGFISYPKLVFWRFLVPISVYRCRKVLTISENSKKEIIKNLRIEPNKILVTPLALDKELANTDRASDVEIARTCEKYCIRRPYFLNVGGIGEHKNPLLLVKGLKQVHGLPEMRDISLVITGRDYGARNAIEEMVKSLGLKDYVCLPGYVSRQDLPAIYSGAFAYVSPSYYEGFGLTILEAMGFGTPVIASGETAIPEVAGGAAILIKPNDSEQLAEFLYKIRMNEGIRNKLVMRGYERVKEFSWEKCARLTMEAYEQAAKKI